MKHTIRLIFLGLVIMQKAFAEDTVPLTEESLLIKSPPVESQEVPVDINSDQEVTQLLDSLKTSTLENQGEVLINEARIANKRGDLGKSIEDKEKYGKLKAEKLYMEALQYKLTPQQQKDTLIELAMIFEELKKYSKKAMIYEKYLEKFPDDPTRAQMLIQLGLIYRNIGSFDMAIDKFYSVLDISLKMDKDQLALYRYLSVKAQLEIAETYFQTHQYEKATKLYARMKGLDLSNEEKEQIQFNTAYAHYNLSDFQKTIELTQAFIDEHPLSSLTPQCYYILANAYKQFNKPDEAIQEVVKLLKHQLPENLSEKRNWNSWKKQTANQLANYFYEQGDYLSALKIYQTMAPLDNTPNWQWPIIYQIGRSFERLQMFEKAKESYELIASGKEWENQKFTLTEKLKSIQEHSKWRLDHLKWLESSDASIKKIVGSPAPEA